MSELNNLQINKRFAKEPRFGACCSQGSIKHFTPGKFYILNLDKPSGPGTHWVLASYIANKPYYFNSFGLPPDREIINSYRGSKSEPPIEYNSIDYQPLASDDCGYRCVAEAEKLLDVDSSNKSKKKKKSKRIVGTGLPIQLF